MMNPNKGNSTLNTLLTMMDNTVSRVFTALPVEVLSVDSAKRLIDVLPLVSMVDNEGNSVDHAQISNIPYIRLQAGGHGIIIDPVVGDKGLAVFCSRDISNVVASRDRHIPASMRKHSISDAVYVGSLLNEEPTSWIRITDDLVEITAAQVKINGDVTISGDAVIGGISFKGHVHGNGNKGQDTTGPKG